MKKKKWNKILVVFLSMVTALSLCQDVARRVRKKKMQKQSQYIYGAQTCMKNMHHISRNSFRISMSSLL